MLSNDQSPASVDLQTWLSLRKNPKQVVNGSTLMTPGYLKHLCKEQKGYQTPSLNDCLYLHFKGFSKIENLSPYLGLKSLWLEGNGISKISGLESLVNLKCLFLQQNCITEIEGLENLILLDTLNLSNNLIKTISGISNIPLTNLNLSHNLLTNLTNLDSCKSITILDLSNNKIDNIEGIETVSLAVLNLMHNPVRESIPNFRKTVMGLIKTLTYLDDRPIAPEERLVNTAWLVDGIEGERLERERIRSEKVEKDKINFEAMMAIRDAARERKRQVYGEEEEVKFTPEMEKFRDEMLDKIQEEKGLDDDVDLLDEVYNDQVPPPLERVRPSFIEEITDEEDLVKKPLLIEEIPHDYEIITATKTVTDVDIEQLPVVETPGRLYQDPNFESLSMIPKASVPQTPSKYGFIRNPPMASVREEEEPAESNFYKTPLEQRRADLELLLEMKDGSFEELTVPLLEEGERKGNGRVAWADQLVETDDRLCKSKMNNDFSEPEEKSEPINLLSKDETLVELEIYDQEMLLKAW